MPAKQIISALLLLGLSSSGTAAPATPDCVPVHVRFPPTIKNNTPAHWQPPPVGWEFGYWYQTNSSSPNSFQRNLQYSTEPLDRQNPTGPRTDLASFQTINNDTVLTVYGVDTPSEGYTAVYDYAATGILTGATDELEILAWGYDNNGVGYRLSHSTYTAFTKSPASIDVLSRSKSGPDSLTLSEIQKQLEAFGNANITALAKAIVPAIQDNGRDGQPPVDKCDAQCQTNQDLIALLG